MDPRHFGTDRAEVMVVLNGCDFPDRKILVGARREVTRSVSKRRVGFLGSSHSPNVEAAEFILREMVPAFPDVIFEFVGEVCTTITTQLPPNVQLHGTVDELAKSRLLNSWDVALNPVLSGGGSSVKLPDYLVHGLATISTPAGARGFSGARSNAGIVVDIHRFSESLAGLLADSGRLAAQRRKARCYAARHLLWEVTTKSYRERVRDFLMPAPAVQKRRSLLVVTYRYTEPPLGGAEEYAMEVLKHLRPRFAQIDLAAVSISRLTNHHHFGCAFYLRRKGREPPTLLVVFSTTLAFSPQMLCPRTEL